MRLPKELDLSWSKTVALSWAFFWRNLIITVPILIFCGYLQRQGGTMQLFALLLQIVGSLAALVFVFRWLFRDSSFGSIRLVLMEQADFQELASRLENQKENT